MKNMKQQYTLYVNTKVTVIFQFNLQMSISADASFPVGPKWILINFPCVNNRQNSETEQNIKRT